jgi:hypothetical protein
MSGTKIVRRHGERRLIAKADKVYSSNTQPSEYIEVVPSGRQTYLWVGTEDGPCYMTVSGPATLRRLAWAILDEVGGGQ